MAMIWIFFPVKAAFVEPGGGHWGRRSTGGKHDKYVQGRGNPELSSHRWEASRICGSRQGERRGRKEVEEEGRKKAGG